LLKLTSATANAAWKNTKTELATPRPIGVSQLGGAVGAAFMDGKADRSSRFNHFPLQFYLSCNFSTSTILPSLCAVVSLRRRNERTAKKKIDDGFHGASAENDGG
jgi:hypothetical protein